MNIIFLGAPSCGKGTQAKVVSKNFKVSHISTGDLLREKVENLQDPLGLQIKEVIDKGLLVDDQIIIKLIDDKIKIHAYRKVTKQTDELDERGRYQFLLSIPSDCQDSVEYELRKAERRDEWCNWKEISRIK